MYGKDILCGILKLRSKYLPYLYIERVLFNVEILRTLRLWTLCNASFLTLGDAYIRWLDEQGPHSSDSVSGMPFAQPFPEPELCIRSFGTNQNLNQYTKNAELMPFSPEANIIKYEMFMGF